MDENKNKNEEHLAYLCDRIQKITEAVYRVTDLLPDKEPMKWKMREESVFIFTRLMAMKDKHFLERNAYLEEITHSVNRISLLFSLFTGSGPAVLSMNFKVLEDEYCSVKKAIFLETQRQDISALFLDNNLPPKISNGQDLNKMSDTHSIGHFPKKEKLPVNANNNSNGNNNNNGSGNGKLSQKRKDKVFEIVKDKGRATVSEVAAVLKECSEKTIQRDLLELVGRGVLRKEGDKRWRRYMLADIKF